MKKNAPANLADKSGKCVFCGQPGLSKTHILAVWLNELLTPKRDAKAAVVAILRAGRCGEMWRVFGPGGSYGRQLVRMRRPSDAPFRSDMS
jgi:hypothetical protein